MLLFDPPTLASHLLLYIPLLALTDRQNHGRTNTLASRGLEELFFYYDRQKKVLVVCLVGA